MNLLYEIKDDKNPLREIGSFRIEVYLQAGGWSLLRSFCLIFNFSASLEYFFIFLSHFEK